MTKTQVSKGRDAVRAQALKARQQALKAQQQARQAATQIAPLTTNARTTARQGMYSARAWTAPRLERSGQALQERVAPKVSAMLSNAARRIEPAPRARRRWPILTAGLVAIAGAAAAAAAAINRRSSGSHTRPGSTSEGAASTGTASETSTGPADVDGRVHTP